MLNRPENQLLMTRTDDYVKVFKGRELIALAQENTHPGNSFSRANRNVREFMYGKVGEKSRNFIIFLKWYDSLQNAQALYVFIEFFLFHTTPPAPMHGFFGPVYMS